MSKDNTAQTSANVRLDTASESLSKAQTLDVEDLLIKINLVYQDIKWMSADSKSPLTDFVTTSLKDSKSMKLADDYKNMAEQLWKKEKYEEALLPITRSIAFAETDSVKLASAYSDRSYIHLKLKRYKSCIQDVNRATNIANCPTELKKKLRKRKKECCTKQENSVSDEEEDHLEWRSCRFEPSNIFLPNVSSKLKVGFDREYERHLFAMEDIPPGEILSIEDFYVMATNPTERYKRCSFCFLLCDTLIPCSSCTLEMYCSMNCRINAFNSFHRSECEFIRFYERERTHPSTILAVREFLIGTEQGKHLTNLMKVLRSRDIFVEKFDRNCRISDYPSALQVRRINWVPNIVRFVLPAVESIIVLLRSSFFRHSNTLPDRLGSVEAYAALLLINHMITAESGDPKIMILNPSENSVSRETPLTPVMNIRPEVIGIGICLLQSHLIHVSCYANVGAFIQKRKQVLFATRTIRSGDKITICPASTKIPPHANSRLWCSQTCPKVDFRKIEETSFSSLDMETNIEAVTIRTLAELEKAEKQAKMLSNKEILKLIVKLSKFLCEMLTIPSFDIILCEQLLLVFMKVVHCDHHRQYKDFPLGSYFNDLISLISERIHDFKFSIKNEK